jgi:uncharacterized HhH-GPD family protein
MSLYLSGDADADRLLTDDPLALLIGMVLDQQIPLEWAFRGPYELRDRLGGELDVKRMAAMPLPELTAAFRGPPALHRYPASMAKRVQDLCCLVVDQYGGDAANVWHSAATGAELKANLKKLPGFGEQKAKIFVALLGKQLGVRPPGWQEAAGDFGRKGSHLSVADIDDPESLAQVREHKRELKLAAKSASTAPAGAGASRSTARTTRPVAPAPGS